MSDVEAYWNAICAKAGIRAPWNSLPPDEQIAIVQSINTVIAVLNNARSRQ